MVHELQSSLAKHLLNGLRARNLDAAEFRRNIRYLTLLLADQAFGRDDMSPKSVLTWQGSMTFESLKEEELVFVTILRAGLPMLEAALELFPQAKGGFLAMARDETTHKATLYYSRLPECRDRHVIVVDPMIATGGSLSDAVALLYEKQPAKITSLNIIAAPEGLDTVMRQHETLELYVAQIDERLNDDKYIVPGLGDAGDRAFNTF